MVDRIVWATIVLFLETLIVIGLYIAVYNVRRLRISFKKRLMTSLVVFQGIIFFVWMFPTVLRAWGFVFADPIRLFPALHFIIGITVAISAVILVIILHVYPDINIKKLRILRPLMIYTFIAWQINYLIGLYNYINGYILR
ncbi:MAG: hypothetical protein INQ03_12430 [Candidatus Heimdallarchaeota archaeon]|nr:hypothetical protein [Candidatus Heimdallarchaeota archaeon]